MMAAAGLSNNPNLDHREPGLPVGLKNLGATCYMVRRLQSEVQLNLQNSYLQVRGSGPIPR